MPRLRRIALAAAFAAGFLPVAPGARALDAFWHGVLDAKWETGKTFGASNWYSRPPPDGAARDVPDGAATFTEGALRFEISIGRHPTEVGAAVFPKKAPRYAFTVEPNVTFRLVGEGVVTATPRTPRFVVRSEGRMQLKGAAHFFPPTGLTSAGVFVEPHGRLDFTDTARGGNADVRSRGRVTFVDSATAENMTVAIFSEAPRERPDVLFADRSTAGDASFDVGSNTTLDLGFTQGPNGDGALTAGSIANAGLTLIDKNRVTLSRSFSQGDSGSLSIRGDGQGRVGRLLVDGAASLSGELQFHDNGLPAGSYRVLFAKGGRTGRLRLRPVTPGVRLAYSGKEVRLIID